MKLFLMKSGNVRGVRTREGDTYYCPPVILTTGTFLNGLIHVGQTNYAAGRQGEESVANLSAFLQRLASRCVA